MCPGFEEIDGVVGRIKELGALEINEAPVKHKNVIDMVVELGKYLQSDIFWRVQDQSGVIKFGLLVKPKEIERLYSGRFLGENAIAGRFFCSKKS
jgi:hypothetical protein